MDETGATCRSDVRPWLAGTPEEGIQAAAAGLGDSLMSYAAAHRCPPGTMPVTVSMRLEFVAPPPPVGSRLTGQASIVPASGEVLLARGEMAGPAGTVAVGTLRSLLVPVSGTVPRAGGQGEVVRVVPPPVRQEGFSPPPPALGRLLELEAAAMVGLELVTWRPGAVELTAEPAPPLERTDGVVHGGAIPIIGQLAAAALASDSGQARATLLDLAVDYLRPTRVGEAVRARAHLVHRSRRLVSIHTEIVNAEGRPTARVYETVVVAGGEA